MLKSWAIKGWKIPISNLFKIIAIKRLKWSRISNFLQNPWFTWPTQLFVSRKVFIILLFIKIWRSVSWWFSGNKKCHMPMFSFFMVHLHIEPTMLHVSVTASKPILFFLCVQKFRWIKHRYFYQDQDMAPGLLSAYRGTYRSLTNEVLYVDSGNRTCDFLDHCSLPSLKTSYFWSLLYVTYTI